jgi:tRNA threonylcarbamoyladenosine biosynthesis protein TsaE
LAERFAACAQAPLNIGLDGGLGAGKTQWIRYFCEALGVPADVVTSPTYVLLQRYQSIVGEIYHLDFYRLENVDQVWDLGFDELQEGSAILLVEWAGKFPQTLPADRLHLAFESLAGGQQRRVTINASGTKSPSLLAKMLDL